MKTLTWVCMCVLSGCAARGAEAAGSAPVAPRAVAFVPPASAKTQSPPEEPPPEDDTARQIRELRRAQALYRTFIEKAGDEARFRDAVQRSRERIQDIDATIAFLEGRDPPH